MPIDHPLTLFLFSALAIIAVGITGLSVLAAVGSAGLLINLILFIILGLPSSGGTAPIEATPKYLGWLATCKGRHRRDLSLGCGGPRLYSGHHDGGCEFLVLADTRTGIIGFGLFAQTHGIDAIQKVTMRAQRGVE